MAHAALLLLPPGRNAAIANVRSDLPYEVYVANMVSKASMAAPRLGTAALHRPPLTSTPQHVCR